MTEGGEREAEEYKTAWGRRRRRRINEAGGRGNRFRDRKQPVFKLNSFSAADKQRLLLLLLHLHPSSALLLLLLLRSSSPCRRRSPRGAAMAKMRVSYEYSEAEDKSIRLGLFLIACGILSLFILGFCWLSPTLQSLQSKPANCTVSPATSSEQPPPSVR